MTDFLQNAAYFGVMISLGTYMIGLYLARKLKSPFINPLLISIILTIIILIIFSIDYDCYYISAKSISYLLTPATVCLSIPLYNQLNLLKDNWKAIIAGTFSGVLTSLTCILAIAVIFNLGHTEYVTLLPKSITTAIGIGVSEELKGDVQITAAVIIMTGIFGNIVAELVCKIFKIKEPIAKGIAIGTSSHAIGTAKAMDIGETEGSMSSLSIVVSGLLTIIGASIFAQLL